MAFGIEDIIADLEIELTEGARKGFKEGMELIKEEAVKLSDERIYNTPLPSKYAKRTGNYRKSMELIEEGDTISLSNAMDYAIWVEYKHQKMILNDAVYNNVDKVREAIQNNIL